MTTKKLFLKERVEEKLKKVIDPGTGLDVLRMKLIRNLEIQKDGLVSFTFRPSSPVCPLAFKLASDIQETVKSINEVKSLNIDVDGFIQAEQLKRFLEGEEDKK